MKELTSKDFDAIIQNMNAAKKYFAEGRFKNADIGYLDDPKTVDVFMMVCGVYSLIANDTAGDIIEREHLTTVENALKPAVQIASLPTDEELAALFVKPTKRNEIVKAMMKAVSITENSAIYRIAAMEKAGILENVGSGRYIYAKAKKPKQYKPPKEEKLTNIEEVVEEEYKGPTPDFEAAGERIVGAAV